jgi:nicotinamidase-related amidase
MKGGHMKITSLLLAVVFLLCSLTPAPGQTKGEDSEGFRPALVVIDVQNKWLPMMDEKGKESSLSLINAFMKFFRYYGHPVIVVYHTNPEQGPEPESEAFTYPSAIEIAEGDLKITKNFPNAFKKTELNKILQERKCNTLFLCGLSAVGCVLATYFGAQDLDYRVFMIKDALLSHDAEYTRFVEDISDTIGASALSLLVKTAKK